MLPSKYANHIGFVKIPQNNCSVAFYGIEGLYGKEKPATRRVTFVQTGYASSSSIAAAKLCWLGFT